MKTFTVIFCTLLAASSVFAQGAYNMAEQQAKKAVAREAQNQQAIGGATSPAPATPPPSNPQSNPALAATLQNIANLRADFQRLDSNPKNQQPLINDLAAAAQGTKAKPASISKLAESLSTSIAGNNKLAAQHQKLAQSVHAIFNSSHLSPTQQQTVLDGVQKVLLENGVPTDAVAGVIGDLKTIAAETR